MLDICPQFSPPLFAHELFRLGARAFGDQHAQQARTESTCATSLLANRSFCSFSLFSAYSVIEEFFLFRICSRTPTTNNCNTTDLAIMQLCVSTYNLVHVHVGGGTALAIHVHVPEQHVDAFQCGLFNGVLAAIRENLRVMVASMGTDEPNIGDATASALSSSSSSSSSTTTSSKKSKAKWLILKSASRVCVCVLSRVVDGPREKFIPLYFPRPSFHHTLRFAPIFVQR